MTGQFDVLINSYLNTTVGIAPFFLNKTLSDGLHDHILQLQEDGLLKVAGIGNDREKDTAQNFRTDSIYWLDKGHDNSFEQQFLDRVDDFICHLNETCYTGINACEFHYAVYEEGSFYRRHKDQFRNDDNRKYSLINYLNTNWQEEEGGHLLIHQQETVQKILPEAQTAVFFKSDETEHEVTISHRSRMSITGWLKRI